MDVQSDVQPNMLSQSDSDSVINELSNFDLDAIYQEIVHLPDIDPDSYSPCYEMVREVIKEYSSLTDLSVIGLSDMDLLYSCIVAYKSSNENLQFKIKSVNKSHLSVESKNRLVETLQKIDDKIRTNQYSSVKFDDNDTSYWTQVTLLPGVAAGMNMFGDSQNKVPRVFIELCIQLLAPCEDTSALDRLDHVFSSLQYFTRTNDSGKQEKVRAGLTTGAFSSILHALKPSAFPPIYGKGKIGDKERGIGAFQKLFKFSPSPMMSFAEFSSYLSICKTLFDYKEKNEFSWSNYIVLIDYWLKHKDILNVINGEPDIADDKRSNSESLDQRSLLDGFQSYVLSQGFSFPRDILASYVLSLQTKPFVILSGISGTGKTKIAQLFAEYLSENERKVTKLSDSDAASQPSGVCKYIIQNYNYKYKRIYIPTALWQQFSELPEKQKNVSADLEIDGEIQQVTLSLPGSTSNVLMLPLNKSVFALFTHFTETHQLTVGDTILISVVQGGVRDKIILNAIDNKMMISEPINTSPIRHAFISVRPDWTDNKGLLGFYNPLVSENQYQPTALLKIMIDAKADPLHPYFVILDEMNLAKVEHYFSDFLSCLESRRADGTGNLRSEKILLHDADTLIYSNGDETYEIPGSIEIPENIYFTGTINVDESTYMFSPKVLDRANVIEFNDVNMESYYHAMSLKKGNPIQMEYARKDEIRQFTNNGEFCKPLVTKSYDLAELEDQYSKLHELHSILKESNLHFGYRVIDEVLTFLSINMKCNYFTDPAMAFDRQILQKILPKLNGNRRQLDKPLEAILDFALNNQCPESAQKIRRMKAKLDQTGYTSFIE